MSRAKGSSKTPGSGRKKGSSNKHTLPDAAEKAEELGIDPFKILLHFAAGDWKALGYKIDKTPRKSHLISKEIRARAATEANQYLHPKKKSVEIDLEVDDKRPFTPGDYEEYIKFKRDQGKDKE